MIFTIILFLYGFIIVFDFLPLLRKRDKKQTLTYFSILVFTFIILVLNSFDISIPSPANAIKAFIKSIF